MAYTFLDQMRKENIVRFGADVGPAQPDRHFDPARADLKNSALRRAAAVLQSMRLPDAGSGFFRRES